MKIKRAFLKDFIVQSRCSGHNLGGSGVPVLPFHDGSGLSACNEEEAGKRSEQMDRDRQPFQKVADSDNICDRAGQRLSDRLKSSSGIREGHICNRLVGSDVHVACKAEGREERQAGQQCRHVPAGCHGGSCRGLHGTDSEQVEQRHHHNDPRQHSYLRRSDMDVHQGQHQAALADPSLHSRNQGPQFVYS